MTYVIRKRLVFTFFLKVERVLHYLKLDVLVHLPTLLFWVENNKHHLLFSSFLYFISPFINLFYNKQFFVVCLFTNNLVVWCMFLVNQIFPICDIYLLTLNIYKPLWGTFTGWFSYIMSIFMVLYHSLFLLCLFCHFIDIRNRLLIWHHRLPLNHKKTNKKTLKIMDYTFSEYSDCYC